MIIKNDKCYKCDEIMIDVMTSCLLVWYGVDVSFVFHPSGANNSPQWYPACFETKEEEIERENERRDEDEEEEDDGEFDAIEEDEDEGADCDAK